MKLPIPCNPVLGNGVLYYDVEARVFNDRLYLYGGSRGTDTYTPKCSEFRVFSTDDMVNFIDHGPVFSADMVRWTDAAGVWAPDCICRDDVYYLYFALPGGECGVAKSDKPEGPFEDVGQIVGVDGIDPTVLVDDDGQAYLYYGQCDNVCVAKLNADMVSIDLDSIEHPLTVAEHNYHEGISIRKVNGRYYLVYTDTSRHGNIPMCQGHAVSDHPMHGFTYKGVLVDNFGCDPMNWNDHGSIACFKGEWYIFYHKAVMNNNRTRQLAIEKLTMDAHGDFREVEMTASGIYGSIPATAPIPASTACPLRGSVYVDHVEGSRYYYALTKIVEGDSAVIRYIDFNGETTAKARVRSHTRGRIEFFADGEYVGDVRFGKTIAEAENLCTDLSSNSCTDLSEFEEFSGRLAPLYGRKSIEMRFFGYMEYDYMEKLEDMMLDEISFSK